MSSQRVAMIRTPALKLDELATLLRALDDAWPAAWLQAPPDLSVAGDGWIELWVERE